MTDTALQQVTVKLPKDLVDYIQVEASRRNVAPADILQKAVVNDRFLREQQDGGSNVLLEKGRTFSKVAL